MTDQGTHLMDVVQWMTNSGPPPSAVCQGQVKWRKAPKSRMCSGRFRIPGLSGNLDTRLLHDVRVRLVHSVPWRQRLDAHGPARPSALFGPGRV